MMKLLMNKDFSNKRIVDTVASRIVGVHGRGLDIKSRKIQNMTSCPLDNLDNCTSDN